MKKALLLALVLCLIGVAAGVGVSAVSVSVPTPLPIPVEKVNVEKMYENVTKIVIEPRYKHFRLMPGDEKEFEVKLKNPNDKDVGIKPKIVVFPFMDNYIDEDWISFDKDSFVLKAGEKEVVKIKIKVPEDAEKGYYSCMIAFTNDTLPMSYPSVKPMYVNQMSLSVNIWIPPVVKIYPKFIDDRVEAGKSYEYKIYVENTGDEPVKIAPNLWVGEEYYYDPFSSVTWLKEDFITIEAPKEVPPKSKVTVKVNVNVPVTAKGILRRSVVINADDPALDEWMQRVELSLRVYEKPNEPFVKSFFVSNASKVTVKVSASSYGKSAEKSCDFDVKIISPNGVVDVKPSKLVEEVGVTLSGSKLPPWEETEGIYTVTSYKKTEVYTIENPASGTWKVEILPSCESFNLVVEVE